MPHDLIDNQNIKLADIIKQTLPGSAAAHFAVGSFIPFSLEVAVGGHKPSCLVSTRRRPA